MIFQACRHEARTSGRRMKGSKDKIIKRKGPRGTTIVENVNNQSVHDSHRYINDGQERCEHIVLGGQLRRSRE